MSYTRGDGWSQPRDFNSIVQTCSSNIQKISQNSSHIRSLLQQLGIRPETSELQDKLQQLQHYTNQLAKETNRNLKELNAVHPPPAPSEQRQQKLQKERLMSDFSAALNNFQELQRRAAESQKECVARARAASRGLADGGNVTEQLVTFEKEDEWSQVQTEEIPFSQEDLDSIRDRETSIRQLEADIMDVNQIFKDLAVMIHDQGETIDSIEANVETAEIHVDRGAVQLQKAAYYQRKSRKRLCLLAMVASLVLFILIIIIWQAIK
ncbi:syntaxin-12 [Salarias fasciatus]|uniref:syntaxin-12 n=1 Tax=Salarias fasciatus TaxID=181472 RepID=UPI001176EF40|nr:syntaxin-12-like [Salarias fasciatus]